MMYNWVRSLVLVLKLTFSSIVIILIVIATFTVITIQIREVMEDYLLEVRLRSSKCTLELVQHHKQG